jgi:hypothetical protein
MIKQFIQWLRFQYFMVKIRGDKEAECTYGGRHYQYTGLIELPAHQTYNASVGLASAPKDKDHE